MTPDLERIDHALRGNRQITPLDKLFIYQRMSRVWRQHLDPQEIVVMTYVVDRTVGWGHLFYVASHKNVLQGTEDYSGIGLSERTYYETLKRLEVKGLIFRTRRRDRTQVVLNLLWQAEPEASIHSAPGRAENIVPMRQRRVSA